MSLPKHHQAVRVCVPDDGPGRRYIPPRGARQVPRDPGAALRQLPHGRAHVQGPAHLRRRSQASLEQELGYRRLTIVIVLIYQSSGRGRVHSERP